MTASWLTDAVGWAALAAGTAISFISSGMETGIYVINKIRLDLRAESGAKTARRLRLSLLRPGEALAVLLLSNSVGNYLSSAGMVLLLTHSGWRHPEWQAMLILTPLIFIFCELLPKNLFHRHAETLTYALGRFLTFGKWVFTATGLAALVNVAMWGVLRLAGRKLGRLESPLARGSHLAGILAEGRASGVLTHTQSIMAERVINIRQMSLSHSMVPLDKAVLVSQAVTRDELRDLLSRYNHPRVGVHSGPRENIIGVLNIYDVLLEEAEIPPVSFLTPAHFLSQDRGIFEALLEMQRRHQSIAFIRNAEGKCTGLVTVKDLVEEIVGELEEW